MSVSNSKNVRTSKLVVNAVLAGLVAVGGTGLATAALAPAANAAATFCCSGGLSASPTDPGLVTVTYTNNVADRLAGTVVLTNPAGTLSYPVPGATSGGYYDIHNNWVPSVASVTTYTFRLLPGQTAQAKIEGVPVGNPYTNTSSPVPGVVAPTRDGNVITIPGNQGGAVQYIPLGGAAKPLPAGYQFTLKSGETVTIGEITTDTARTTLGSWTFSYVAPAPAQVTPEAPTLISGNLYKVPAGSGYHYEVAGQVVIGTVYATKEGTTVKAVSDSASLELVGQTSWPLAYATPPVPNEGNKKIMICHATGSATNPYKAVTVSVSSLRDENDHDGHAGHSGDIWPETTYQAADDLIVTIAAHNWTEANAKIYADNCEVEAPTPPPSNGGGNGDHGGNTGGGNTTPPPSSGNNGGGNTNTGSTTPTVPVSTPVSGSVQTPVTGTQPAGSGLLVKADTGVNPSTDPTSINVFGGLSVAAAIGAFALLRRPKHRAE